MPRKYNKQSLVRFPEELYHDLKEAVAYQRTNITEFINNAVKKEVKKVIKERNQELAGR